MALRSLGGRHPRGAPPAAPAPPAPAGRRASCPSGQPSAAAPLMSLAMTIVHRVTVPKPVLTLDDYRKGEGGDGLDAARKVEPEAPIDEIEASGLRGRGGGGFPTGRK